jgi:membrane protein implicated in regulation of membrane protease activity
VIEAFSTTGILRHAVGDTIGNVPGWAVWLIVAALFAGGEVLTSGFILGPLAIAAALAALAALAGAGLVLQLLVFIVASVASVVLLRPIAVRHLRAPARIRTGTAALVGTRAVVLERVDELGGRVKIGGEVWSARAFMEGQVIEPGARVEVAEIEGATALVIE